MVKVWGKIFKGEKMIKTNTLQIDESSCTFFDMLRMLCEKLDIPTPILLEKHVMDFNQFNMCLFKTDDFVENVNFSRFVIENISTD